MALGILNPKEDNSFVFNTEHFICAIDIPGGGFKLVFTDKNEVTVKEGSAKDFFENFKNLWPYK